MSHHFSLAFFCSVFSAYFAVVSSFSFCVHLSSNFGAIYKIHMFILHCLLSQIQMNECVCECVCMCSYVCACEYGFFQKKKIDIIDSSYAWRIIINDSESGLPSPEKTIRTHVRELLKSFPYWHTSSRLIIFRCATCVFGRKYCLNALNVLLVLLKYSRLKL